MNNTTDANFLQQSPPFGRTLQRKSTTIYVLGGIQVSAGLILNCLYLLARVKARGCKANTYAILNSLALCDIGSALTFGIYAVSELCVHSFKILDEICKYTTLISLSFFVCNLLHILWLSGDRWVAIAFPHRQVLPIVTV